MIIFGFILGTVLGSFVKVLADRSLNKRSFWGRSYCPKCKHKLHWYDLFPIFAYLFLKGKCRYCKNNISIEYLLLEVTMGILIGYLFLQASDNFQSIFILDLIFKTFFVTVLMTLFLTDFKKMLIPDRIVLPAILIGTIYLVALTIYKLVYLYFYLSQTAVGQKLLPPYSNFFQRHAVIIAEPLFGSILSAILIGGFFMALIAVTKGKGMGGGDVKLGALMGLVLGFPQSLVAVMLAFLSGATISLILIFSGKKHFGQSIPFGPFLVLGSLITLFWGNQILDWYLHLLLPAT